MLEMKAIYQELFYYVWDLCTWIDKINLFRQYQDFTRYPLEGTNCGVQALVKVYKQDLLTEVEGH